MHRMSAKYPKAVVLACAYERPLSATSGHCASSPELFEIVSDFFGNMDSICSCRSRSPGASLVTDRTVARESNADQSEYWNSAPGKQWIEFEEDLDSIFSSVTQRLLEHGQPSPGEKVLDIGCGTGATSMDLAKAVGPQGSVIGVDISRQLLARAEKRKRDARLNQIDYLVADAQIHKFAPDSFDLIASRFGVMFFDDPVAAFSNLAASLRRGGRLSFAAWASISDNPWFKVPRDAAVKQLGTPSPTPSTAPGPLAFQDTEYVIQILEQAGWSECTAAVEEVHFFHPSSLPDVAYLASNFGPSFRIMREFNGSPEDLAEITSRTAAGFKRYAEDGGFRIPATLNFYDAVKS